MLKDILLVLGTHCLPANHVGSKLKLCGYWVGRYLAFDDEALRKKAMPVIQTIGFLALQSFKPAPTYDKASVSSKNTVIYILVAGKGCWSMSQFK